jgi:hypothetical protein
VAFDLDEKALDEAFAALSDFEAVFTVEKIRLYELGDAGWRARTAHPLVG